MPPLLKTYFNPSHRSFLQTLFCATFLASLTIAAFPCPVRHEDRGRVRNEDGEGEAEEEEGYAQLDAMDREAGRRRDGRTAAYRVDRDGREILGSGRESKIVMMMNQRGKGRRFMEED